MRPELAVRAERLRSLHTPGAPLVLPNAWDAASARLVIEEGFAAVATTSAGVALSLGYADHEQTPPGEMFAAIARIARAVAVPVTADLEAGYGLPPAALVERLLDAGAVGCNLEDTDHAAGGRTLVDASAQADRIAAVREVARGLGVPLVINARTDGFLLGLGSPEERRAESLRRGRLYLAAGADCLYPILAGDEADLTTLADAGPINVLLTPKAPPIARLAELGVARVSLGPFLHRHAMDAARARVRALFQTAS
jgi:2-methylisocitrate lyase-like PEP mutase family enzyme